MIQTFVCDCLNVSVMGDADNVNQTDAKTVRRMLDAVMHQREDTSIRFLSKCTPIQPSLHPIKITHTFLCFKRTIDNWQINYCAICKKETHAIPINNNNSNNDGQDSQFVNRLILVGADLSNDENMINTLKMDARFSAPFGIVLPRNSNLTEPKTCGSTSSDITMTTIDGHTNNNNNNDNYYHDASGGSGGGGEALISDVERQTTERVKQFLYDERRSMEDRIKNYAMEQNKIFERLCQTVEEEKGQFMQVVHKINKQKQQQLKQKQHQHHELVNPQSDSFDKENKLNEMNRTISASTPARAVHFSIDQRGGGNGGAAYLGSSPFRRESIPSTNTNESRREQSQFYNRQSIGTRRSSASPSMSHRSPDFDGLFDMDDLDGFAHDNAAGDDQANEEIEDNDFVDEQADTFPLKEAGYFSNENQSNKNSAHQQQQHNQSYKGEEEVFPSAVTRSSGMPIEQATESGLRTRKVASSVVQNIPSYGYHASRGSSRNAQMPPNSLPIKIPQYRPRVSYLDDDESFYAKPGESIGDRIQKIARSVRNENDVLDDRPRRRLNTGDLLRSRPILN